MKFSLTTSGYFYSENGTNKLKPLGFTFSPCVDLDYGEFTINDTKATVEISSLEELMQFVQDYGTVVLGRNYIEIYDDYRE